MMATKAKTSAAGKKAVKALARKAAPARVSKVAPKKVPVKPKAVAKPAPKKAVPEKAPKKAAPAKAALPKPAPSGAKPHKATVAMETAVRPAAFAESAERPVARVQPAVSKTQPTASAQDVAAAHEYLLSRSASRSEEPVVVNGRRLLTEEQLLKMPDAEYMNEDQLGFFKYRLQQMERELLSNADETTEHLRETVIVPDPADRATIEEEHALELRTRDRERKLLKKVQSSLARIEAGDYGFCEETGEPIGIPRLLARPTATLSLEAQQRREMKQKLFGD
jgi:DnaK suppressor protein